MMTEMKRLTMAVAMVLMAATACGQDLTPRDFAIRAKGNAYAKQNECSIAMFDAFKEIQWAEYWRDECVKAFVFVPLEARAKLSAASDYFDMGYAKSVLGDPLVSQGDESIRDGDSVFETAAGISSVSYAEAIIKYGEAIQFYESALERYDLSVKRALSAATLCQDALPPAEDPLTDPDPDFIP